MNSFEKFDITFIYLDYEIMILINFKYFIKYLLNISIRKKFLTIH